LKETLLEKEGEFDDEYNRLQGDLDN